MERLGPDQAAAEKSETKTEKAETDTAGEVKLEPKAGKPLIPLFEGQGLGMIFMKYMYINMLNNIVKVFGKSLF